MNVITLPSLNLVYNVIKKFLFWKELYSYRLQKCHLWVFLNSGQIEFL